MAKFNPDYRETQDPNYLNYSKGVDAPKPSTSFEKLFEGVSSTADGAVKLWDQANTNDIKQQATAGVDAIRTDMGVDVATDRAASGNTLLPNANGEPVPNAITSAQGEVGRLKDAYSQGKINDSYYWGRVNALAKTIRTQYPGYRDQIDSTFSGITGADPANALRKAIQSDFNDAQNKLAAAGNKEDSFVNSNLPGVLQKFPDYFQRKNSGNPIPFDTVRKGVGDYQSVEASTKATMLDMDLKAKQGTLQTDELYGKATAISNNLVGGLVNSALEGMGANITQAMKSGKPLEGADADALRKNFGQFKTKAQVALNQYYNKAMGNDPTRTIASTLKDPAKLKAMTDNAMANINAMEDQLINGQYGLFNQTTLMNQATTDADVSKLLKSEDLRKVAAAQKLAPQALNLLYQNNPTAMSKAGQAINSINLSESIVGEGSLTKQLERQVEDNPTPGGKPTLRKGAGTSLIDGHVALLNGKDTPDEVKINTAKAMFSPGEDNFLTKFNSADQLRVFQRLTSPETTQSMLKLRSVDPTSFNNYRRWATNSFSTVLKTQANTAQQFNTGNDEAKITFDPGTWQFKLDAALPTRNEPDVNTGVQGDYASQSGMNATANLAFKLRLQNAQSSLSQVNAALSNLKPILEVDGKDPEGVAKVLTGIDAKSPKEQGFLQWLGNSIIGKAKADTPSANPKADVKLASYSLDETQGGLTDSVFSDNQANLEGLSLDGEDTKGSSGKYGKLLDMIGQGEAGGNYNRIYGKNREAPLGDMTVQEVMSLQNRMLNSGSPSTAVGKYQFINKTLSGLVRSLGIGPDEKFTPQLQDKLATALLKGRGLADYESGKITKAQFINNLSQEWAAVKNSRGSGHYDGDGLNRASVDVSSLL